MQTPLLSLSDFKALLEIPEALEFIRLRTHVIECQEEWLLDKLQHLPGLYADLAAALAREAAARLARATAVATYNKAVAAAAKAGTPAPDVPEFPALAPLEEPMASIWQAAQPMLVYASYASYLPFSQTTLTAHSLVQHSSDNSPQAPSSSISKQVTTVLGWAQRHQVKLGQELQRLAPQLTAYAAPAACSGNTPNHQATVAWLPIRNKRR